MTGKLKAQLPQQSKYEIEIQKLRNENKWAKLRDFIGTISIKDKKSEILFKFCTAESNLETYLFNNPLLFSTNNNNNNDSIQFKATSNNILSDKNTLTEIETMLKDVITRTDSSMMEIDSNVLLGKLYYSQAKYDDATKALNTNSLKTLLNEHLNRLKQSQHQPNQQLPKTENVRQLQIYAEAHALRALCFEIKKTNSFQANAHYKIMVSNDEIKQEEQEIIDSFEMSSLLAIHHSLLAHQQTNNTNSIQNLNTLPSSSLADSSNSALASLTLNSLNNNDENLDLINPLYEIALQKAPLMYIKRGELQMGLRKFRDLLLKNNIQSISSIRQILLKKFAESLMFSIPVNKYSALKMKEDRQKSLYKPLNQDEEILLCLTISQHLASKEVMLLRQAQFKQIREHTFNNAVTSLDLFLVFLAYNRCYKIISEKYEMTMKYSFEQFYVWYQYALTLICDRKYYKAFLVLKECNRMNPEHVMCVILLSKIAIENLFLVNEATEWGQKAVELTNYKNKKALIIYGSSMCIKAKQQKQHAIQIGCYEKALDAFRKAHALDTSDFLPLYHIAHCQSILRQINEAMDNIQKALKLKPDDKDSMHLLALLLTSTKNYDEAHTILRKACALYDDCELFFTKIKIEEILYDFNQTVASFLSLIVIFKQTTNSDVTVTTSQHGSLKNYITPGQHQSSENWSSFEAASLLSLQQSYKLNETIGKTSTMLLEADQLALKYGYSHLKSQEIQQILVLVRTLTQIGEFYLRHDKLNDAEQCCQEISTIHPMSYLHIYLKGRIFEYKQDYLQAKLCYQNALSINPHHISSLQQMAIVLCQMQNFHLAEKMIRDAISLNSSLPDSWHILARILDYQNDNQSAMKCYQTCLQLEASAPILPFSSLTRIL